MGVNRQRVNCHAEEERYTRRQFLARTGTLGISLSSSARAGADPPKPGAGAEGAAQQKSPASLEEIFLNPPFSTRPMTRWWWFGAAMTKEEITRELTIMRSGGLRGVELQPVYPVAVNDPKRGIHNIPYFSTDWFDLIKHTAAETRRLGMQFDFTLGSGWPYGGPFIPIELAARQMRVFIQDFTGPVRYRWDLGAFSPDGARMIAAILSPVLPSSEPDLARTKVIRGDWPSPIEIPEGHWRLMVVVNSPTFMQVKRPTLGMEGYVLDHFNRDALDLFLDAAGNRTLDELKSAGLPAFHSIFCDSLEVEGADWTGKVLPEFERRRGYDLTPYLPALWQEAGALTPHIRYDYHRTLSELILENFFTPLAEWARKNGMSARVQAHGAMGDVMHAYGVVDIPEGERIGGGDRYLVDIAHRRLASSAGHIYQKPLVSAETYTWLRAPLFLVTLEMMKAATDGQFLDGINQIVNSGYPSSPPQVGLPGWTFYASTVVNSNNIWWRHYQLLAEYVQRTTALLQCGTAVNPVGIYLPLADVYAKFGAGGLHMDEVLEAHLGTQPFLALRQAGYDFDFINDDALARRAQASAGRLLAGWGNYPVVIIPGVRYIPITSWARLADFARQGGTLIFVERIPEGAPGLMNQAKQTAQMRESFDELLGGAQAIPGRTYAAGGGNIFLANDYGEAIDFLRKHLAPDFEILEAGDGSEAAKRNAVENVGFVHRRKAEEDFYFLSNISNTPQNLRVRFSTGARTPQRWNPETAKIDRTLVYDFVPLPTTKGKATEVQVRLEPYESCFIVFSSRGEAPLITRTDWPGPLQIEKQDGRVKVSGLVSDNADYHITGPGGGMRTFSISSLPQPVTINGVWDVRLGSGPTIRLQRLKSWTELPQGSSFSGWGTYETTFEMRGTEKEIEWTLDLGSVHETAEAFLNGVSLGAAWKGWRRLRCREALRPGQNTLRVAVGNLWINHVAAEPPPDHRRLAETYGIRWGTDEEKLRLAIPAAGLLGPVRLIPFRPHTEFL